MAPRDFDERAPCVGARAGGHFDEAPRGAHRRARLRRFAARSRLRARHAGPRRCLLQHDPPSPRLRRTSGVMKFGEIFRFEFVYQAHRVRTWLYFVVLLVVAYLLTRNGIDSARDSSTPILANSPYGIAVTTLLCNVPWMLIAAAVAGSAAARDVQTRMHPLVYTTPVSKAAYLGGQFSASLGFVPLILA